MRYIFLGLLLPYLCFSQDITKGKILDKSGKGISKAMILYEVTQLVYSDEEGNFMINKKVTTIEISADGFMKKNATIDPDIENLIILEKENEIDGVLVSKTKKSTSHLNKTANVLNMSQKELQKAACCNLSESFETNPSIDVNFADAVTGNKQIKMLGLTSPYILMSEENIPTIRGALQSNGLNFVSGTSVESIQITKGAGSVVNGYESISGQINYELKKPIKAEPFFLNTYASNDGRYEVNADFKNDYSEKISSLLLFHGSTRNIKKDNNHDGFMDNPLGRQINLINRWQYNDTEQGFVGFLNIKYLTDNKTGGQIESHQDDQHQHGSMLWTSEINTEKFELSNKIGHVFKGMPYQSIGWQNMFQVSNLKSTFGNNIYNNKHTSYFSNLIFNSIINNTKNKFITGVNFAYDKYEENLLQIDAKDFSRIDNSIGAYFEYSYDNLDQLSFVLGGRADYHNRLGIFVTPRFHLKYLPFENTTIRISVGRGKRASNFLAENMHLLASSRKLNFELSPGVAETAWNYGASLVQKFYVFEKENELVVDFYRTDFSEQVVIDLENPQAVNFNPLRGKSYANALQIEWNLNLMTHLDIRTAYKFQDVKTNYSTGLLQRPLQAIHRFFTNIAYETHINKKGHQWKFDATWNWTGKQRLPDTSSNPLGFQYGKYAPDFSTVIAQITRTFSKNLEVYIGGENLTNFKQNNAILGNNDPFGTYFDSTLTYGPVFGRMFYAGLRFKIR